MHTMQPDPVSRSAILYVDDEEANTYVFAATFGDEFDVLCAHSAAEALDVLQRAPVAVLVSDQRMPGMSGTALCAQARLRHPDVVRVLMTAYSDHQTAAQAINEGEVARFVAKPWSAEDLRLTLRELLHRVRLEATVRELRDRIARAERIEGMSLMRERGLQDLLALADGLTARVDAVTRLVDRLSPQMPILIATELQAQLGEMATVVAAITATRAAADGRAATALDESVDGCNVHEVVELAGQLVRPEIDDGCSIINVTDASVRVRADRTDVIRILRNLLTNAAAAVASGDRRHGGVRIRTRCLDHVVEIEVCDDGPGVPESLRERVFEPLFTTRPGRSGLGLAIARDLAAGNGGELILVPDHPEPGACFALRLPRDADANSLAIRSA